jgi:hypothetical protein
MYVQVFTESTNGTFLQNSMCELFDMLEQYIGNVGTHGLRAKLVWSLVTTKAPKCSYRVELLTVIWSNKYEKKFGPTNIRRNGGINSPQVPMHSITLPVSLVIRVEELGATY